MEAAAIAVPPCIERKIYERDTPWADMLDHHLARVAAITAGKGGAAVVMRTLDDTLRFANRQKSQKDAYRESVAWITRDELQRMAHGDHTPAGAVFIEVQKLLAAEAMP